MIKRSGSEKHMFSKILGLGLITLLCACVDPSATQNSEENSVSTPEASTEAVGPKAIFSKTDFSELEGWASDDLGAALATFRRTCSRILDAAPTRALDTKTGAATLYGTVADWQPVCAAALQAAAAADPRSFFEDNFQPFRVADGSDGSGLLTGYYEPEVRGSLTRSGIYQTPLLTKPADLLRLDLQDFDPSLGNESIRGRIENGRFVPYPDRAAINRGALDANALAVAWIADPVDAFFVHIQGSARILLPDGDVVRVGYAGKNGRPYTAIGRVLVERGAMEVGAVTMQSIRDWLSANPQDLQTVLEANQSYVFFNAVPIRDKSLGPTGAAGVALTAGRSLAVDRRIHSLGAPVWLNAPLPGSTAPHRRLMIAQDTGSAIRGAIRGDYFWGSGSGAGDLAGETKAQGQFWVLIPKERAENWVPNP
jgi:peptidoglycan lytic transglycosylase A